MAETTRSSFRRRAFQVLLPAVDTVVLLSLAAVILVWIAGRFELRISEGVELSILWWRGPPALLAAVLLLRYVLGNLAKRAGVAAGGLLGVSAVRKGFMALLVLAGFFLLFEGILILIGFEDPLPAIIIQDAEYHDEGIPDVPIRPDRELLWFFKSSGRMHGQPINQIGFPDRQVDPVRKPNSMRVICMGDSCTADAVPPYPVMLHELLLESPPTARQWEAFHTAVHGYSVLQGLVLFRKVTRDFQPDVVTLYFGWNDHWCAGHTDRARMTSLRLSPATQLLSGLREKRFFQLLARALKPLGRPPDVQPGQQVRVEPDDYHDTLTQLVREIRQAGAMPILLTAPRASELLPLMVERGHGPSLQVIYDRHEHYAQLTRDVARKCNVPLLDLAAIIEADPRGDELFFDDGIHFNPAGRRRIAELIRGKLVELYGSRP